MLSLDPIIVAAQTRKTTKFYQWTIDEKGIICMGYGENIRYIGPMIRLITLSACHQKQFKDFKTYSSTMFIHHVFSKEISTLWLIGHLLVSIGCNGKNAMQNQEALESQLIAAKEHYLPNHPASDVISVTSKASTPLSVINLSKSASSSLTTIIAKGGHQVTLLGDHLNQVLIKKNLPFPFSQELVLPVYKENHNLSLKDIMRYGVDWRRQRIHVQFPTTNTKGYVYMGSMGLQGGGGGHSKCIYKPDEAVWDSERGCWMCPAKNHPRNEPYWHVLQRKEETRRKEEARAREEARLKREADYLAKKEASAAVSAHMRQQMELLNKKEEARLAALKAERQALEQQWIKEQQEKALLRKQMEETCILREAAAVYTANQLAMEKQMRLLEEQEQSQLAALTEEQLRLEEQWRKEQAEQKVEDERAIQEFQSKVDRFQEAMERKQQADLDAQEITQFQQEEARAKEHMTVQLQDIRWQLVQAHEQLSKQQEEGRINETLVTQIQQLIQEKDFLSKVHQALHTEDTLSEELASAFKAMMLDQEEHEDKHKYVR
eukprot:gene569-714_t